MKTYYVIQERNNEIWHTLTNKQGVTLTYATMPENTYLITETQTHPSHQGQGYAQELANNIADHYNLDTLNVSPTMTENGYEYYAHNAYLYTMPENITISPYVRNIANWNTLEVDGVRPA